MLAIFGIIRKLQMRGFNLKTPRFASGKIGLHLKSMAECPLTNADILLRILPAQVRF
jgi:hypothetical protein